MMATRIPIEEADARLDCLRVLPRTTAEPVRATVTVYPHRMVLYRDGVQRATVCRGEVDVVDFYRKDDQ